MKLPTKLILFILIALEEINCLSLKNGNTLMHRLNETTNLFRSRNKRYLGLSRRFKINKRYQECIAPGDAKGHCKHLVFCPMSVLQNAKNVLDSLCVIERMHVGICCPDDIALSGLSGSQIILDLPGGGYDYDDDNSTGCGIIMKNPQNQKSNVQDWPWIAALFRPDQLEQHLEQQFCGGALITELHVLTAAHCTVGLAAEEILVRLGEYDFSKTFESRSRDYAVESITNHENFEKATYANDIAIVKLKNPTSFNSYIWPICLPPVDKVFENEVAIVAGWGQQYYAGPVSAVLKYVNIPVWPLQRCTDAFLQSITEDNLCAAAYEGGKDACLGDSGGPLMFQLENGRWITIGIVSWGIGCGNKGSPGVYTKVANYIPWIIKHTIAK